MFDTVETKSALPLVWLKRATYLIAVAYLVIGLVSAYRAFYQVHSVRLQLDDLTLRRGSTIETSVISYARTHVDVRLELIQGTNAETLALQRVPGNEWAFFDPRSRAASQTAVITDDILKRFEPGKAELRATAIGRPQWTRLPPPVIEKLVVNLQQN